MRNINLSIVFLVFILSCTEPVKTPIVDPSVSVSKKVIVAVYDYGNNSGLYLLDSDSLIVIDTVKTFSTPSNGVVSYKTQKMYFLWSSENGISLHEVNLSPFIVTQSSPVRLNSLGLINSEFSKKIFVYGVNGLQIFSSSTLNELYFDSTLGSVITGTSSPNRNAIYIATLLNGSFNGIFGYDVDLKMIVDTISVSDTTRHQNMQTISMTTSIDGKYLFISGFNYTSGGGFNSFIVFDLSNHKIVNEYICGQFAQLKPSEDGKFIYISNPAGYNRGYFPTDTVYKYDIELKSLFPLIKAPAHLGINENHLYTDQMAIDEENQIIYFSLLSGLKSINNIKTQIVGYDLSKNVPVSYYKPKEDINGGYQPYSIRDINFIKITTNKYQRN